MERGISGQIRKGDGKNRRVPKLRARRSAVSDDFWRNSESAGNSKENPCFVFFTTGEIVLNGTTY